MIEITAGKYLNVYRDSDAGMRNDNPFEVYAIDFGTAGAKVRFIDTDGTLYVAETAEALEDCTAFYNEHPMDDAAPVVGSFLRVAANNYGANQDVILPSNSSVLYVKAAGSFTIERLFQ